MDSPLHDQRGPAAKLPESPGQGRRNAARLYAWGAFLHEKLSRIMPSVETEAPLISIGNIEVGGTGKTPALAALANLFLEEGIRPSLLTGWPAGGPGALMIGTEAFQNEAPDEAQLLAARFPDLPLAAARPKRLGAQELDRKGARVILLDDGFQHRRLERRLDLLLLSGEIPMLPGQVLPAGPLREHPRALERADAFLLPAGAPLPVGLPERPVWRFRPEIGGLFDLEDRPVEDMTHCLAVSAIARPERFEEEAARRFTLQARLRFRDHAPWTADIRDLLVEVMKDHPGARPLLTEKDARRWGPLWDMDGPQPCYLRYDIAFEESEPLVDWLRERLPEL